MLMTLLHPDLPSTATDLPLLSSPLFQPPFSISAPMSAIIPLNEHFYRVRDLALQYATQTNLSAAEIINLWSRIEATDVKPTCFNVFHGYDLYICNHIILELCPNRCTFKPERMADIDRIPLIYSATTPHGQEEGVYLAITCVHTNRNKRCQE